MIIFLTSLALPTNPIVKATNGLLGYVYQDDRSGVVRRKITYIRYLRKNKILNQTQQRLRYFIHPLGMVVQNEGIW